MHTLEDVKMIPDLNLPTQQIQYNTLVNRFPYIREANFEEFENTQPMLLIGQRHAKLITTRSVIESDGDGPILSKTKLGWALHGPVEMEANSTHYTCCQTDDDLHQLVKHQFSLDSFGVCLTKCDKTKSLEDQRAHEIATNTIIKLNYRFEINLPWKNDSTQLPESKHMAQQRLICLERRLKKDKTLSDAYQREIDKLLEKGYARKVTDAQVFNSPKLWFLPHFDVLNPNKPEKVRLVFDAAAKSNGTSLNDNLLTGPDWLTSIVGILMRFRLHSIAFVGDIKEMFNQVLISDEDVPAQCFLWRNLDSTKESTVYQMKAMLFGTNSSPFIAQFVKNYNAQKFTNEHPEAVKAIVDNHYVADYLDSKSSVSEAVDIISSVIQIHKHAGFEIRNFISNSQDVLSCIPKEARSEKMSTKVGDKEGDQQKVLGILWDAASDTFIFSINKMHRISEDILNEGKLPTKRKVLAAVNSVYDPIGLVSPITIKGRILMRDIWESGIGWDDQIKGEQVMKWQRWLNELQNIEKLKIPRCYSLNFQKAYRIELHVFNDASSKAYSSVAYLRFCHRENKEENFDIALVASKARVSPLKHVTIPKLETLAAVMGCRLALTIQKEINLKIDERFFWTDSKTVLTRINSEKKMQSFIANRIGEICDSSKRSEWYWISTTTNIADIITRDDTMKLDTFKKWFSGPTFLKNEQELQSMKKAADFQSEPPIIMTIQEHDPDLLNNICKRVSSLNKTIRCVAWIKRFIDKVSINRRKRSNSEIETFTGDLHVDELKWAESILCKIVQQEHFPNDYAYLESGKSTSNMRLTKISLLLDKNGVMRVVGRIERAEKLSILSKNPIVLDGNHPFTKMLIINFHKKANHTGLQVVVHKFKEKYWMPKINYFIKKVIRECIWCRRKRAKPMQPKMGLLPAERFITSEKAFSATGIDYFGPFYTRDCQNTTGRRMKTSRTRYGVIFTCLTTRAVHVEIAYSLSTDSCIMAIRRMMARRGHITTLWSDNGTNFRGASRELLQALEELEEPKLRSVLALEKIDWKFIPANAPNFGGCWERLVGCFKRSIESVLCVDRNPTDEVLQTLFCEAEHLVNSRPYLLESENPDDDIGLCPNDILIQQGVSIYCPGKFSHYDSVQKRQWRVAQLLIDRFWSQFLKEYIPTLLNRSKWHKDVENVQKGDIVILKENNTPRGDWPLGVITKVYPGEDGVVRVVDVRTLKNEYRRPVNRLCQLGLKSSDIQDRAEATGSLH